MQCAAQCDPDGTARFHSTSRDSAQPSLHVVSDPVRPQQTPERIQETHSASIRDDSSLPAFSYANAGANNHIPMSQP